MNIRSKTGYTIVALTALILWIATPLGCSTVNVQKKSETPMDYNEIQQKVDRVRQTLESGWDGSIAVLRQNADDEPEDVRRGIYAQYWRTGVASSEAVKRAAIVEFMIDKIAVETPMLRGQLLKWLQDFRKEDFNANARIRLNSLPWNEDFTPEAIRLIGIAEISEAVPRLQQQIKDHPLTEPPPAGYEGKNTWAALLALARMGDDSALSIVLRRVQQEEDIITRATILFEDLGYTRRPAAFDLLRKYLNSDKRMPQIKDNVPGTLEASRAAAVFSKYIRGFPIQETDFNERETMQARAWVNAQTSWQFK